MEEIKADKYVTLSTLKTYDNKLKSWTKDKYEIPVYTKDEYENKKDNIEENVKFIIKKEIKDEEDNVIDVSLSFNIKTKDGYEQISGNNEIGSINAENVNFNNENTKMRADNVQAAIDEVYIPIYTKEEFEAIKETIPIGTKFIIIDDEYENDITVHNNLKARDAEDSHPISAITGLLNALNAKMEKVKIGETEYIPDSGVVSIPDYPTELPASDVTDEYDKDGTAPVSGKAVASAISGKLDANQKGVSGGVAELDENGKVPSSQLPSYVDDVIEATSKSDFPTTGESGKIYVDTTTNLSYRWGGTDYVEISKSLALGENESTAFRGDYGKIAYDHATTTATNPHGTTASDVGLGNVGNFKAVSTVASQGLTDTEKSNARANIGAGTGNGTYSKPSTGIPKTDLASDVQTSLGKADTALQSHQSLANCVKTDDSRLTDARQPVFSNNTWYSVGDDVKIGDHNTAGGLGIVGANGNTRLDFCKYNDAATYKSIIFDGTNLSIDGKTLGVSVPSDAKFTDTTYSVATTSASGLMSTADKTKLDGIATGANNYSHPTTSGNKHIPSGGSSGQILRWGADGTAVWGADNNTTYSAATTSTAGLMSAADKTKLNGIATSANNYSLPTASASTLGGIKVGTNLSISSGVLSAVNTTYSAATTSAAGLMSAADKTKLNNITYGRKANTTVGTKSTAEGSDTTASGNYSHAEGLTTTASNTYAHAEGCSTTASGTHSHAEGNGTTASGICSHAEGDITTAKGTCSHVEGSQTIASSSYQHVGGKCNVEDSSGVNLFIIGNGTLSARSNAFSITTAGTVKAKSTITASTTADYAEFFEWLDSNPDNEDRVGYFVTLDGDKIRIANEKDSYILGVVSGEPFVLGNGDCDAWNGMYLRDKYRRTMYEPAPKIVPVLDKDGNRTGKYEESKDEFEGIRGKLNPNYDATKPYIPRADRPEWSAIGMLGVLAVNHDGTARVNGYVTVNKDGIATACEKSHENSYRVIKSNADDVVEIIFR